MTIKVTTNMFSRLRYIFMRLKLLVGIDTPLNTYDRRILEDKIMPFFIESEKVQKILFVGCDWYTAHYPKQFPGKEFWTIDPNKQQQKYSSSNHIVDMLENLHNYFDNDYFDIIICNGVFGWGLNTRTQCEQAFGDCFHCVREGGYFVLGWNNTEELCPLSLESLDSLKLFNRYNFLPLNTWRFLTETENQHTYDFYVKAEGRSV